ncbi:enoyl-CoA hydratase/isomerase family protein [Phreatobacter stygius]|uniref:Enoyl-CoA hydratase/isomerase family protein n=1 Tax=Phreatobacter stygius TaxID=1940610 RepID=A0A4D7BBH9_9HYPH|nr:enoyl-CoA hydratase/isomerase family protein [Phreatobacter stygius]
MSRWAISPAVGLMARHGTPPIDLASQRRHRMSTDDPVLFDVADGIAKIRLNRPERLNTLDAAMAAALLAAFRRAEQDRSVKAVTLTGEHLCFGSSLFWSVSGPSAVLSDKGVGEDDELSSHGDEGAFGLLALGDQAVVETFHVGVAARGRERRQVENAAHPGASAPDDADALSFTRIIGDRG